MSERTIAEDLLNNIVESIADGLSKQKSLSKQTSGSFFEQEKSSSVNSQLNRLFGRQKPVHHILGGGKCRPPYTLAFLCPYNGCVTILYMLHRFL